MKFYKSIIHSTEAAQLTDCFIGAYPFDFVWLFNKGHAMHPKFTAIICNENSVAFYLNGKRNNNNNASFFYKDLKHFYLDGKYMGNQDCYNKSSWRKFIKLSAFL